MAKGSASMTSNAMSCSNSSVRERADIGESGRQMIWLFFDGGAMARCWWLLMQKLICKHKGLIPNSNVKAWQLI